MKRKRVEVVESSGNVFRDLGLRGSAEALARAELAGRIVKLIGARGLNQTEAASLLGIDQPGVSDLVRGKLRRYSTARLIRFLVLLGQDVEIRVRPTPRGETASLRVVGDERPGGRAARGPTRDARNREAKVSSTRSRKAS